MIEPLLLTLGFIAIIGAISGGGFKAKGFEIPLLGNVWQKVALGTFGAVLMVSPAVKPFVEGRSQLPGPQQAREQPKSPAPIFPPVVATTPVSARRTIPKITRPPAPKIDVKPPLPTIQADHGSIAFGGDNNGVASVTNNDCGPKHLTLVPSELRSLHEAAKPYRGSTITVAYLLTGGSHKVALRLKMALQTAGIVVLLEPSVNLLLPGDTLLNKGITISFNPNGNNVAMMRALERALTDAGFPAYDLREAPSPNEPPLFALGSYSYEGDPL